MSERIVNSLRTLKRMGFDPHVALDIGAYHGDFSRMFRRVYPRCSVVMFEPQESSADALIKTSNEIGGTATYGVLLGARTGQHVRFYEMETGSSIMPENSQYPRRVRDLQTVALDDIRGLQPVDFIKLDVQGYELEVLKGGIATLASAQALLVEASLVPINKGCPLIGDVVEWLGARGFRMFDICSDIRRRDGVLWQTDLMFVRNGSGLEPRPELTAVTWG